MTSGERLFLSTKKIVHKEKIALRAKTILCKASINNVKRQTLDRKYMF